ncbi:hypothetical protein JD276_08870 [Leucobacter sp. CSA1]|uniref:Uncharacterized protein n=1 Tax=Leucobacter chromiisoli TaxID=2796471 RepID=A0A934Q6F2_9MICO|nr:hypothetical protein [Leucobacter chromiisoli]MBK0419144.1 hypothetical protein [Leucobacter chromiisoli]
MAEASSSPESEAPAPQSPAADDTGAIDLSDLEGVDEIEISPVDENGNPRSRREMRELRAQAIEALRAEAAREREAEAQRAEEAAVREAEEAAAREADAEAARLAEAAREQEAARLAEERCLAAERAETERAEAERAEAERAEAERAARQAEAAGEDAGGLAFDDVLAPTQPFTVADLQEAERPSDSAQAVDAEDVAEAHEPDEAAASDEAVPAAGEQKPRRRMPWRRNSEPQPAAEAALEDAVEQQPDPAPQDAPGTEAEAATEAEVLPEDREEAAEPGADAVPGAKSASSQSKGYSFPDIVPPEEWRSVFDDPETRVTPSPMPEQQANGQGGDFDDLISRAVAQEGGTGSSTSALILPSMPNDGRLSGPIGETGELFVTGSIDLPRSLGETGGHAALHESVEVDSEDTAFDHQAAREQGSGPVAARRAVSAMVPSSVPVVSETKKERSKLPLVLSLTGGALLLGVGALVVWGASNGMFG